MKRTQAGRTFFLLVFLCFSTVACQGPPPNPVMSTPSPTPEVSSQVCCGDELTDSTNEQSPSDMPIESVSMGDLEQGDLFEHTFVIKNETSQTLQPEDMEFNYPCCVTPTLNFASLAPNETGELRVKFDSRFRGGPIDIFVQLPWKGTTEREQFHIGGRVRESFKVWPTGLRFTQIGGKVPLIVSGDDLFQTFNVLEIVNPCPDKVKVSEPKRSKDQLEYTVEWIGSATEAQLFDLEVRTDHPRVPVYPVRIAPPGTSI
jgi:Protein of unknown function (DUF1573)